jgi:hypothetical protein
VCWSLTQSISFFLTNWIAINEYSFLSLSIYWACTPTLEHVLKKQLLHFWGKETLPNHEQVQKYYEFSPNLRKSLEKTNPQNAGEICVGFAYSRTWKDSHTSCEYRMKGVFITNVTFPTTIVYFFYFANSVFVSHIWWPG